MNTNVGKRRRDVIEDGYRLNICIIVANRQGKVLWARRSDMENAWQFPQGGMKAGESACEAMYRELHEEVGLTSYDVDVVRETQDWFKYTLKSNFDKNGNPYPYIGQKQKWFLVRLLANDSAVDLSQAGSKSEFDAWKWVSYWYPMSQIADFKREVYRGAMLSLASSLNVEDE